MDTYKKICLYKFLFFSVILEVLCLSFQPMRYRSTVSKSLASALGKVFLKSGCALFILVGTNLRLPSPLMSSVITESYVSLGQYCICSSYLSLYPTQYHLEAMILPPRRQPVSNYPPQKRYNRETATNKSTSDPVMLQTDFYFALYEIKLYFKHIKVII